LTASPEQARYAAIGRWKMAQAALARTAGARGEPRWTAGLRRNEAADAFGLVFGLEYAWPARAAAAGHAAEARAGHDLNAAEAAAALLEARATLFALCQELNHARIEHDAARDELQPAAQRWLSAVDSGQASGRYGLRDLLEARAAQFSARRRQIEAAAEYHSTLIAIEQLLGGPAQP
jgi:cobalt-zinc-cadmium efflux system outer membrane protein